MLKILVTYAVQGEFVELKWPDIEPYYIRTGIGKGKSAFHLAEAIRQVQPDLVLNIGSAGTVNHQVGDIFVCRKFVDRDMQKMAEEGDEYAALVRDAFFYQISKDAGAMAAVLNGKVDQIILTGGIAYAPVTRKMLEEKLGWIAPFTVYPGEDELLALAQGGLRVIRGEEAAKEY